MKIVIGLTGASCSIYGISLINKLVAMNHDVTVIFSDNGLKVAKYELKKNINEMFLDKSIKIEDNKNIFAHCASGTNAPDALVIMPCSMGTLAAIAHGISSTLMHRTADVMLKEKKKMILCTREAPYSLIHLKNMVQIAEAGGVILPCSPGFYLDPKNIDDLINFMVGKVLDVLGLKHDVVPKWGEQKHQELL